MSAQRQQAQRQHESACDCCPAIDPEQAAYEAWCEARSHPDEVDAMRDFLMQHKRVTGVVTGAIAFRGEPDRTATVQTDSFAEWTDWDKRTNFRNREMQA